MRRYRFTQEASRTFDSQIDYLLARNAFNSAESLNQRVHDFIRNTLCLHPAVGRHLTERCIWETWIPRTRMVTWYTFDDEEVVIITFWHTAQQRTSD